MDDRIDRLLDAVEELIRQERQPSTNKELYTALAAAQAEMLDIKFTGENCYYKDRFATLGDLVRMSRPALTKHGLCVFQDIRRVDETEILRTTLAHTSGQTITTEMPIKPNKNTLTMIGSYIAYLRRVSYATITGLMIHDSDDDDSHGASFEAIQQGIEGVAPQLTAPSMHKQEYKRISKAQSVELEKAMGTHYDLGQEILSKYGVDSFMDISEDRYAFLLGQIRKNVAQREGQLL